MCQKLCGLWRKNSSREVFEKIDSLKHFNLVVANIKLSSLTEISQATLVSIVCAYNILISRCYFYENRNNKGSNINEKRSSKLEAISSLLVKLNK